MKKFTGLIAVTAAVFIFAAQLAQAQDTAPTAADFLPPVDIYYEMSTSAQNPLEDFLFESINSDMVYSEFSDAAEEKLLELAKDTTIVTAMEFAPGTEINSQMPALFTALYIEEEDFNFLLEEIEESVSVGEYNGTPYYSIYETNNFVYLDGIVFTSNTIEGIQTLIDNYLNPGNPVLADIEGYKTSVANRLAEDFFFMYMDPSIYGELLTTDEMISEAPFMSFYSDILEAVYAEGISVAQTETGFDFAVYVEGDYEKLEELDLLMDKYNFVPELYTEVSGKNIIYYAEQYNLAQSFTDIMNLFGEEPEITEAYAEFKKSFQETTGYNFDTDILKLFTGNYLIAVHNDANQIFPAVTMIFESSADRTGTINMLANLSNTMKTEFEKTEKESGMEYYSYQIARAGGASFYQHRFDLTALLGEYSVGKDQMFVVSFTLDGNRLVISTHSDLDSIYGKDGGIVYNETFNTLFTDRTEELSGITFFDATGLREYLAGVMSKTGASEEEITFMNELLTPWHTFFGISKSTANTQIATGSLTVDVDGLTAYGELFENMFGGYEYDYEYPEVLPLFDAANYCDVSVGDWYYPYVNDLTSMGIVSGYEDGCFGPANEVTRAEFTKMVLGAAEWKGLYGSVAMSDQDIYFNDVPSDTWFWHYVNQAAANGFVKGYDDDTFRPSSPITRAEAAQILYNINPELQNLNYPEPFEDVNESDWYYMSVAALYNAGIVNGTSPTTFSPARNLTRAEAAKMISNFMFTY